MRARPGLRLWHRWFGLLGGAWLILLALSGSAIAFYDEIDTLLNPDLRLAEATGSPQAPLDQVHANARLALPGFELDNLILAPEPGHTHWLLGRQVTNARSRAVQVFADPETGEITGWRETGAMALHRHHLPDQLYALHTELLADETGAWLAGLVALAWLIDHALAVPLAVPRLRHWRAAFTLAGASGSLRRLFDWHRALGLWLWPATAVLAVTSVTLIFPEASRHLVSHVSPVGGRLHETMPPTATATPSIGLDEAVAAARAPGGLYGVRLYPDTGTYAVRSFDPRDPDDQGRLWTYVSMDDGRLRGERHDVGHSAGDAFFAWQFALHSGRFLGFPGRVLIALLGLLVVIVSYSGLKLLVVRSRRAR